jgi:hypothetical protein
MTQKFKLEDEVRYVRESGQMGTGYIQSVKLYSVRVGNREEITVGFPGGCIPQITYDVDKERYYESNGAQIFLFPTTIPVSKLTHSQQPAAVKLSDTKEKASLGKLLSNKDEKISKLSKDLAKLDKRKATRMYRILKFIHDHPDGLRYGEIQKFIFEDIYKQRYNPKLDRGCYGSNLCYTILPLYCKKAKAGKKWWITIEGWKRANDVTVPLYGKEYKFR